MAAITPTGYHDPRRADPPQPNVTPGTEAPTDQTDVSILADSIERAHAWVTVGPSSGFDPSLNSRPAIDGTVVRQPATGPAEYVIVADGAGGHKVQCVTGGSYHVDAGFRVDEPLSGSVEVTGTDTPGYGPVRSTFGFFNVSAGSATEDYWGEVSGVVKVAAGAFIRFDFRDDVDEEDTAITLTRLQIRRVGA